MANTITKALIGAEDIDRKDTGTTLNTFTRTDASSRTLTLSSLDGAHIQFRTLAKSIDDLVDGGYDVEIKPKSIHGGATNTNGHTVPDAADDTFTLNAATQTLTNKTLTSPTISGGTTQGTITNGAIISGGTLDTNTIKTATLSGTITNGNAISGGTVSGATIAGATISSAITLNGEAWPSFAAYLSADQTVAAAATATKVQFNTEVFDTNSDYDNAVNYRFTPTAAGKYLAVIRLDLFNTDAAGFQAFLYKNGALYARAVNYEGSAAARYIDLSAIVNMNGTTDYLEAYVYSATDNNFDVVSGSTESFFEASRIA